MLPLNSYTVVNVVVCIICLVGILGCSAEPTGLPIEGTVHLDGQPLSAGTLLLKSNSDPGQPPHTTRISEGRFAFSAETGPDAGPYSARVNLDEPSVEEIVLVAERDPRAAANQFRVAMGSPNAANNPLTVAVDIDPATTLVLELKSEKPGR